MKYIWAFNPFDRNRKLDKKAVALLNAIPGTSKNLEAVFVASPDYVELTTAFDVLEKYRFNRYPKQLIQSSMKRLGVKVGKYSVLVEKTISLTRSVKVLADYLSRSKTNVVLVASRARTGISRFVLGSFAESLVHFSPIDLLIFNENSSVSKGPVQRLLFAHDYSRPADKGLDRAIDYAKAWHCALHVIHIPDPAYGFKFKGQKSEVEDYRRRVRQKLHRIEEKVKRMGVYGSVELDPRWSTVADRILERASAVKADIVIVVAKSGRLAAFFGGSVTRQVIRNSKAPVFIIKNL